MKIQAQISIMFSDNGLDIQIRDNDSFIEFIDLHLNPKQTCQALSRLGNTPVETCDVIGLEHVGKYLETQKLTFGMPENFPYDKELAYNQARMNCPEGWEVDNYFGSQDSFFTDKHGLHFARATIRRWVDKKEGE